MKPMKAATVSESELAIILKRAEYLYAMPKLDGIRNLIKDQRCRTGSLKSIPNLFICKELGGQPKLEGLDGELIVGVPGEPNQFQMTTSAVMSRSGEPDFLYWVFDLHHGDPCDTYADRLKRLAKYEKFHPRVKTVPYEVITRMEQLLDYEERVLDLGFEGVILRHPRRAYKFGRSGLNDAGMLKLKRFEDSEGVVISYGAEMQNTNARKTDELGRSRRAHNRAGLVAKDTLGYLELRDDKKGWTFSVGSGWGDDESARLWKMGDKLIGQIVTYKFFPKGLKEGGGPRFPIYKAIRDPRDSDAAVNRLARKIRAKAWGGMG